MTSLSCYAALLVVSSVALSASTAGAARRLPSAQESGKDTESLEREGKWWVKVGDDVYYKPETATASLLELGQHVTDYYHAVGSESALTDDMKSHRVAGSGRNHIFYLPEGASQLKDVRHSGPRRSAFSMLTQLKSGVVLTSDFPIYKPSAAYRHPLALTQQGLERSAVGKITEDGVMSYLRKLTSMPDAVTPTRSWTNPSVSKQVRAYLHKEMEQMGLATCIDGFHQGGQDLANVVGFVQGRSSETVTVGAHYDSRPFDGRAPGANDNGSGTAALLAMAKAFSEMNIKPEKSVYFVFFAAEEPGLWGSEHFASVLHSGHGLPDNCSTSASKKHSFLSGKVQASGHKAIIMDEIGWKSPKQDKYIVNMEAFDWAEEVLEHLAQSSADHNGDELKIEHSNNPFGSDHMSYLDRHMPAVLTINFDDEGYPDYHKSTDAIGNVDPKFLTLVTKMNMGGLLRMSGISLIA